MPSARFTPKAEADIDAIADHIAQDSMDAALRFLLTVRAEADKIAQFPGMGPVYGFKSAELRYVRFWPMRRFRKHLLFYRPAADGIEVLRVMHGARNIETAFQTEQ